MILDSWTHYDAIALSFDDADNIIQLTREELRQLIIALTRLETMALPKDIAATDGQYKQFSIREDDDAQQ